MAKKTITAAELEELNTMFAQANAVSGQTRPMAPGSTTPVSTITSPKVDQAKLKELEEFENRALEEQTAERALSFVGGASMAAPFITGVRSAVGSLLSGETDTDKLLNEYLNARDIAQQRLDAAAAGAPVANIAGNLVPAVATAGAGVAALGARGLAALPAATLNLARTTYLEALANFATKPQAIAAAAARVGLTPAAVASALGEGAVEEVLSAPVEPGRLMTGEEVATSAATGVESAAKFLPVIPLLSTATTRMSTAPRKPQDLEGLRRDEDIREQMRREREGGVQPPQQPVPETPSAIRERQINEEVIRIPDDDPRLEQPPPNSGIGRIFWENLDLPTKKREWARETTLRLMSPEMQEQAAIERAASMRLSDKPPEPPVEPPKTLEEVLEQNRKRTRELTEKNPQLRRRLREGDREPSANDDIELARQQAFAEALRQSLAARTPGPSSAMIAEGAAQESLQGIKTPTPEGAQQAAFLQPLMPPTQQTPDMPEGMEMAGGRKGGGGRIFDIDKPSTYAGRQSERTILQDNLNETNSAVTGLEALIRRPGFKLLPITERNLTMEQLTGARNKRDRIQNELNNHKKLFPTADEIQTEYETITTAKNKALDTVIDLTAKVDNLEDILKNPASTFGQKQSAFIQLEGSIEKPGLRKQLQDADSILKEAEAAEETFTIRIKQYVTDHNDIDFEITENHPWFSDLYSKPDISEAALEREASQIAADRAIAEKEEVEFPAREKTVQSFANDLYTLPDSELEDAIKDAIAAAKEAGITITRQELIIAIQEKRAQVAEEKPGIFGNLFGLRGRGKKGGGGGGEGGGTPPTNGGTPPQLPPGGGSSFSPSSMADDKLTQQQALSEALRQSLAMRTAGPSSQMIAEGAAQQALQTMRTPVQQGMQLAAPGGTPTTKRERPGRAATVVLPEPEVESNQISISPGKELQTSKSFFKNRKNKDPYFSPEELDEIDEFHPLFEEPKIAAAMAGADPGYMAALENFKPTNNAEKANGVLLMQNNLAPLQVPRNLEPKKLYDPTDEQFYSNSALLGEGVFGKAYSVVDQAGRRKVAKISSPMDYDPITVDNLKYEREVAETMRKLRASAKPEDQKYLRHFPIIEKVLENPIDKKNGFIFVMDELRPMNDYEYALLFKGKSAIERQLKSKGWTRDAVKEHVDAIKEQNIIQVERELRKQGLKEKEIKKRIDILRKKDIEPEFDFPTSYRSRRPLRPSDYDNLPPNVRRFVKALEWLADEKGIKWDDLHQGNVMIDPKTGEYVALDMGQFNLPGRYPPGMDTHGGFASAQTRALAVEAAKKERNRKGDK